MRVKLADDELVLGVAVALAQRFPSWRQLFAVSAPRSVDYETRRPRSDDIRAKSSARLLQARTLNKVILGEVGDGLFEGVGDDDLDRPFLRLGHRLALDARLDVASVELLDEGFNGLSVGVFLLGQGELEACRTATSCEVSNKILSLSRFASRV